MKHTVVRTDHEQHRGPKNWPTETKRKHQGRAMLQHTISKNSAAAGTAGPMERNQPNANTKSSTPPSKKKGCSRSSRTWAHGNNKAQAPNKCNTVAHHFEKQCGISSGARAHETTTHGNGNNEHPRAQERERGARRTVTREDDGGQRKNVRGYRNLRRSRHLQALWI